jgi:hypothetical protein
MFSESTLETGLLTICRLRRKDDNKGRLKNVGCSMNYVKLTDVCDEDPSALRLEDGHIFSSGNIYFKYIPDSG